MIFSPRSLRFLALVFSVSVFSIEAQAQLFSFIGHVTDYSSAKPVAYATIYLSRSKTGVTSDSIGNFHLSSAYRADTLVISSVGFKSIELGIAERTKFPLEIILTPSNYNLNEVMVYAGKNPADILFKNIIEHKPENDKQNFNSFSYEVYNKLQFDMEDVSEKLQHNKLLKPFGFVFQNADSVNGHTLLPMFLSETISDYYFTQQPKAEKEIIKSSKITGVKNQSMAQFTGSMYQNINVYENYLSLFKTNFISPVADNGLAYYKYYIVDSSVIQNNKSFKIKFKPRRPGENTFVGNFWVDSLSFALTSIEMNLSAKANLNFVKDFSIHQQFEKVHGGKAMMSVDEMEVHFRLPEKMFGVVAKKYTSYKNTAINENAIHEIFDDKISVKLDGKVLQKSDDYWAGARHTQLSASEERTYKMMDSLLNSKAYKHYHTILNTLGTGYLTTGLFEIGPFYNFFTKNNIEGTRYRFGLRTSNQFSKNLMLYGYGAYGTADKRWKYNGGMLYMIGKSPRQTISADFVRDYAHGSDHFNELGSDNVFAGFFRKDIPLKTVWLQSEKFIYEKEWLNGFSNKIILQHRTLLPSWNYSFQPSTESAEIKNAPITLSEITYSARFAWQEKFYTGEFLRTSMGSKFPIVELKYTRAVKGIMNSNFEYQKLYFEVNDKINLHFFGRLEYNIAAGKTFGTLPYPALNVARGNETYYYSNYAFNGMNNYEFVTDHYVSAMVTEHFGTFPFRYFPLLQKLKWRSVTTTKILWGGMNTANKKANLNNEIHIPDSTPYLESGVGVENIFRVLRVDAFWRLTYRELPSATKFGVRASIQFGF
ncbi:MAG: carboxypeptidase-like regulatory domain-containing protein [Sphingobacteriales bacterium]|nr:MAG: carboxypeptidase-like regulatory domain-containing protein [Sphingobacteriales bacterium]